MDMSWCRICVSMILEMVIICFELGKGGTSETPLQSSEAINVCIWCMSVIVTAWECLLCTGCC